MVAASWAQAAGWPHQAASQLKARCSWRGAACLATALATLLLLLLWLQPISIYLPTLRGYNENNFRQHWWRLRVPFALAATARAKAALPKYNLPPAPQGFPSFPIYVISLPNATERRAQVAQQLERRGVPFRFFDAMDGRQEFPQELVRWYLSGKQLREYEASPSGSPARRYMGANLSHYRLMHRLLADGDEMMLVLEDDFELLDSDGDFLAQLQALMAQLPEDWEAVWLHNAFHRTELAWTGTAMPRQTPQQWADARANTWVGQGLRLTVQNNWAIALLIRRSFALKVLNDAQIGDKDNDCLANDICALGNAACYTADPPLVRTGRLGAESQIRVKPQAGAAAAQGPHALAALGRRAAAAGGGRR